jgi:hypothetical protein
VSEYTISDSDGDVIARLDTPEEVCELLAFHVKYPEDLAYWLDEHEATTNT